MRELVKGIKLEGEGKRRQNLEIGSGLPYVSAWRGGRAGGHVPNQFTYLVMGLDHPGLGVPAEEQH